MIHRRKGRKLKRTASHRKALLSNLAVSLITNKKIKTTFAKAKELSWFIESLVTKAKTALAGEKSNGLAVHLRRQVHSYLKDKTAVKTLFDEIAPKVSDRPGGYTRVLKMGKRLGDAAELALIEFVDYNLEKVEQKSKDKTAVSETKTTTRKKKSKAALTGKPSKKKKSASSGEKANDT